MTGCVCPAVDSWSVYTQYYDPRVWVREGEKTLVARVKEACADLGNTSEL